MMIVKIVKKIDQTKNKNLKIKNTKKKIMMIKALLKIINLLLLQVHLKEIQGMQEVNKQKNLKRNLKRNRRILTFQIQILILKNNKRKKIKLRKLNVIVKKETYLN